MKKWDQEVMSQLLGQLLDTGYIMVAVDEKTKSDYYEICEEMGLNPHDVLRQDIGKRTKILHKRKEKQIEELRLAEANAPKKLSLLAMKAKEIQMEALSKKLK
jgi:hypothetical protein